MPSPEPIIQLVDICKSYQMGDLTQHVLQGVSLSIYPGEYVCIMGPSGCGKSTLLNVLGCLDQPTTGDYFLGGQNVAHLNDDDLSAARNRNLGFIFQSYNLIQQLSVIENIAVPMYYGGAKDVDMIETGTRLATQVGLEHRLYHKPTELSGGQQQRVAIARALSNNPLVILADDPTINNEDDDEAATRQPSSIQLMAQKSATQLPLGPPTTTPTRLGGASHCPIPR